MTPCKIILHNYKRTALLDDVRIADTYITEVPEPSTLFIFSLVLVSIVAQRRLK